MKYLTALLFSLLLTSPAWAFFDYSSQYFADIEQPVEFNHQTHALTNQIACEYCHTQARRSTSAGVPSNQTCIGCHIGVGGATEAQKKEIAKVISYWKNNEPIPWKKIHDLPDHVRFSHMAHLRVGFDCSTCHGEVSQVAMPVPQKLSINPELANNNDIPLSMGWCVSCHRTDWNVGKDGKVLIPKRPARGMPGAVPVSMEAVSKINGPLDCLVCHK